MVPKPTRTNHTFLHKNAQCSIVVAYIIYYGERPAIFDKKIEKKMTAWQDFMPNHLHKLFLESFLCNIFETFPQNDTKIRVYKKQKQST